MAARNLIRARNFFGVSGTTKFPLRLVRKRIATTGSCQQEIPNQNFLIFFEIRASLYSKAMLKLNESHQPNRIGAKQVDAVAKTCRESLSFVLALNENCHLVRAFGKLVQCWDRNNIFTFVDLESQSKIARELVFDLDKSPWSVLLVDDHGNRWYGPEAIPQILTHLPFGKVAAVFYILPGTMWLTRAVYRLLSRRNKQQISQTTREKTA